MRRFDRHRRQALRPRIRHAVVSTRLRRALLLPALGGLLIACVVAALQFSRGDATRRASQNEPDHAITSAQAGDCLTWPPSSPDKVSRVDCTDEHRFEVAESVDMRTFPAGTDGAAAAPLGTPVQQISKEHCEAAVSRYLVSHFDPNGKFSVGMVWSGAHAWARSGERRMLCGLQWSGADYQLVAFKGRVADLDQSRVWPTGTCLGVPIGSGQPTVPVDCAAPHAVEVTGAVNLADEFPGPGPAPEAVQDGYLKDACATITHAYLAPIPLRTTTLTLIYSPISLPSWIAGSHRAPCSIGARLADTGWATLVGSAKGPFAINSQSRIGENGVAETTPTTPPPTTTTTSAGTGAPTPRQSPHSERGAATPPSVPPNSEGQPDSDNPNGAPLGPAPGPAPASDASDAPSPQAPEPAPQAPPAPAPEGPQPGPAVPEPAPAG